MPAKAGIQSYWTHAEWPPWTPAFAADESRREEAHPFVRHGRTCSGHPPVSVLLVMPANAGIQSHQTHAESSPWTPAFAGVTKVGEAVGVLLFVMAGLAPA